MNLRIPLERLPVDARERHARLRDYFCDRDAEAIRAERDWSLTLYWPSDPYRHVDLDLSDNLADWGCGLSDMPLAVRRQGRVTTALYDTWSGGRWRLDLIAPYLGGSRTLFLNSGLPARAKLA